MEDLFEDGGDPSREEDGKNPTGIYSVEVILARKIPLFLSIMEKVSRFTIQEYRNSAQTVLDPT
jgi:hypothetical protein